MLRLVLCIIGLPFLLFVVYLLFRAVKGWRTGQHMYMFDSLYEECYSETGSKPSAFRKAFPVFRTCPGLKKLTAEEFEKATQILLLAPDPKSLVLSIVTKLDSKIIPHAFRDAEFLEGCVEDVRTFN